MGLYGNLADVFSRFEDSVFQDRCLKNDPCASSNPDTNLMGRPCELNENLDQVTLLVSHPCSASVAISKFILTFRESKKR